MSTAGHERGLSLRSPGRFLAAADTADRAVAAARRRRRHPRSRDRVADAWIAARAYQLHTFGTVAAAGRRRLAGRGGQPGQGLLVRARCRHCARPPWTCSARKPRCSGSTARTGVAGSSYLFSLAGPIYAGTNEIQRTVIAERLLGLPRGLMIRADRRAAPVRRRNPRAARGRRCARPRRGLGGRDHAPGLEIWRELAKAGVTGLAVPEARGGLGGSSGRPGRRLRGAGPSSAARPGRRVGRRRAPAARRAPEPRPCPAPEPPATGRTRAAREWLSGLAPGS